MRRMLVTPYHPPGRQGRGVALLVPSSCAARRETRHRDRLRGRVRAL